MNPSKVERDITKSLVEVVKTEIYKGFQVKKSPRGTRWKSDKDGKVFDENDVIRNSINVKSYNNTIIIDSDKPYTGYLQYGTKTIPAREMYPDGYFPKKWNSIEDAIDDVMFKALEEINDS